MQMTKDLYKSRDEDTPRLAERMDPVLHGGLDAPGPLSRDQLAQYERDGFLVFTRFFSREVVARLQKEIARLSRLQAVRRSSVAILEPDDGAVRSIFAVHRLSSVFRGLAHDSRLLGMAKQILASQVYIHQSRANMKPGFDGKDFFWHSDFETWHVEDGMPRMRALSCVVALTKNLEINGALMVVPGSHREYISCVGKAPDEHFKTSLRKQVYGVPDHESVAKQVKAAGIVSFTGRPGTVALFDCNLLHGSNSNITPFSRSNVFFVYNSTDNTLVEPFGGGGPRPEFLASRDFTPLIASEVDVMTARSRMEYVVHAPRHY